MFTDTKNLLIKSYNNFGDGIPRITYNLYNPLEDKLKYLYDRDKCGFLKLSDIDLNTVAIETYRPIVSDDSRWASFSQSKLDSYFRYKPPCDFHGRPLAPPISDASEVRQFAKENTPEAYIRTTLTHVELQFPGGLSGDVGDQDYRNLIATRGLIFYNNFHRLSVIRHQAVETCYRWLVVSGLVFTLGYLTIKMDLIPSIGIFAPIAGELTGSHHLSTWLLPATAAIITIAVLLRFMTLQHKVDMASKDFESTTAMANATIAKCAHQRQDALISTADAVLAELSEGKEAHWVARRSSRWPIESQNWSEVLDWLDGRIEANHIYACQNAILLQFAYPALWDKAQLRVKVHATLTCTHLYLMFILCLGTFLCQSLGLGNFGWEDVACAVTWSALSIAFCSAHKLEPEGLDSQKQYALFHSSSFAKLKGKADANISAKRARMIRSDRNKRLFAERIRSRQPDDAPEA